MAIIKRYIKKNGQKKVCYQAQVYVKGFRLKCKTFKTKTEACVWHDKQKEQLLKNPSEFYQEKPAVFFSDCLNQYRKEAFPLLQKSSQQSYEFHLKHFTKSPLLKIKMEYLNAKAVHNWVNWLKGQPTAKNKGRKSFIHELKALSAVLNWYRNFLNEDFNVPITKKHKLMCAFKQNKPRRPDYYIRPEDAKAWVEWLEEHRSNPVYWRLATFMLSTGVRVSEAYGLKWEEISLEKNIARIIRRVRWDHFTRRPELEEVTKTAQSCRLLMLPERLKNILREMKEESKSDLVFTDSKGELLKYNAIQSAFNAGFMALNLPWRSTHICRHTFATIALMTTKNLSAVQASLGHTEIRMTQRYAKTVALLSPDIGEKTFSALFKNN